MTLMRMPLAVWGIFVATILGLLAFPALLVAAIMMALDRVIGTSFFMPEMLSLGENLDYGGGSPILFRQRPNPWPDTFGYHEIWHGFVTLAAAFHFVAVASMLA